MSLKPRIQALADMLKVNLSIYTIKLNYQYCFHKLYRESVIPNTAFISFTESQSFLISRRIDSGRAFLPSKKVIRLHTVPRCWGERFLLYEPIPIAFGCFYQGMPKLPFRRPLRRPLRLRVFQRLLIRPLLKMLLLSLLLLQFLPLLLPVLLHLLLVRSARRVHNPIQGLIHCH
jgi:hypothetical protein